VSVTVNNSNFIVSAATVTTNALGQATVDVSATGPLAGIVTVSFSVVRQGSIPPGTPGNNTVVGTFRLLGL
jgi:hypothetical protein